MAEHIDWDGREAYARKPCAECGEPGTRHFSTEGDGNYWLCEKTDEAHGEERYGGWPSTAPDVCWCERNGCAVCAEMGCRYCGDCAMPMAGTALDNEHSDACTPNDCVCPLGVAAVKHD